MTNIYYYFNSDVMYNNIGLIYLLSYYMEHNPEADIAIHEFREFEEFKGVINEPNSFVLLSAEYFNSFWQVDKTLEQLRLAIPNKKYTLILGGGSALHYDVDSLLSYYPEIDFIKYGRGEVFLEKLLNGSKFNKRVIQSDDDFIKPYVLNQFFINKIGNEPIYITYKGYNCPWGRCKFCCHNRDDGNNNSPEIIAQQISYYYTNFGIKNYYITDNYLIMSQFYKTLDLLLEHGIDDVEFEALGAHIVGNFDKLTTYVPKFRSKLISYIGWGIEFLDDEILKIYDKGTNVEKIFKHAKAFTDMGLELHAYMLLGLPLVEQKHLDTMYANLLEYDKYITSYSISYFSLDKFLEVYKYPEKYKIKLYDQAPLNIQFDSKYPILTHVHAYEVMNLDTKEYLDSDEYQKRFSKIEKIMQDKNDIYYANEKAKRG